MSESLALDPSDERTTQPAPGFRFGAWFKAVLESLVSANARRFEDTDPLAYRFPPI
jgi:hypothetical protein